MPTEPLIRSVPTHLEHQRAAPALARVAAWCWLLTLLTLTLGAGWQLGTVHVYWFDLAMLATLALWAGALLCDPAQPVTLGPPVAFVALAGLVALALLGSLTADHLNVALGMAARLVLLLLFYLYTVNQPAMPAYTGVALLAGFVVQGIVAVGQLLRQSSLGLGFLGERQLQLDVPGIAVVEAQGRNWLRPYGLTVHPNLLGGFLAASLLPMAVCLPTRLRVPAVLGCAALLALTLSRGSALAALLALAVYLLGRRWRAKLQLPHPWWVAGAVAGVALVVLVTPARDLVAERFNPENPLEQYSITERLRTQDVAWTLITRHPLLGVGANNYLAVVREQTPGLINPGQYVPVVHNAFLLAAAELGVVGALLLAVVLLAPIVLLIRKGGGQISAALAAGLVACAVVGLVDFYLWASPAFRLFWVILLGLWAASLAWKQSPVNALTR